MTEFKIIIADPDTATRQALRRMLTSFPHAVLAGEAEGGADLLEQTLLKEPHLILADAELPGLYEQEVIPRCLSLLPQLQVIMMTGYDDEAPAALRGAAADRIFKPVDKGALFFAVENARQQFHMRHDLFAGGLRDMKDRLRKIVIRSDRAIHFLSMNDIVFIEKVGRKSMIHTLGKVLEVSETLESLIKRLDSCFVQTHRSFIVNFERISSIATSGDTNLVQFDHYDKAAYISKHKLQEVLSILEQAFPALRK